MRPARRNFLTGCWLLAAALSGGSIPVHAAPAPDKPDHGAAPPAMLLIASPKLADPRFRQTVLLVLRHGRGGPLGVIVNRPLEVPLATIFPESDEPDLRTKMLHFGGPVEPRQIVFLYRDAATQPRSALPVAPQLWMSNSPPLLQSLLHKPPSALKVMAGYAGWAPGQLEHEIARGDWFLLPLDDKVLFATDLDKLWSELLKRASERQAAAPASPFNLHPRKPA